MRHNGVSMSETTIAFPINQPSSGQTLGLLSDSSFTQLVNEAFRNFQSTLALSRSPLANSTLVTATLILDDTSPTAEERGRGLRLLLRWAVEQIAPAASAYPLGAFRPFDDPTWSEPLWWRYNILRHRYLEPLHPDDFVDSGRYTETLMALTGISSSDAFFDERNRAIREVAERLRQQLIDGAANAILQHMALAEIVRLLETQPDAAQLLGIAAIFDDIFPRTLLLQLAESERVRQADRALDYLIKNRLLLVGDGRRSLWLSATLRTYIYQRQPAEQLQRCHRAVARYYTIQDAPLLTTRHWQRAGLYEQAAAIIFAAAETLINELQVAELIQVLQQFTRREVAESTWRELQILQSDLYHRSGQLEEATAACRSALNATTEAPMLARIYRRLGKLYEKRNQLHALTYYQQAAERFEPTNPELADLLKDRGWLHILRRNWPEAEKDLILALSIAQRTDAELRADILDALADLYRRQQRFTVALEQAQQALAIREQSGNLLRIASSFNNLGNIYRHMGEYGHAISAYEEALVTYRKLGNQASTAGALMNIGSSYFSLGRLADAIQNYQQSLLICAQLGQPHVEATAHYNLAEAYAKLQQGAHARDHWQRGYDLSQRAGFADEVSAFEQLRVETALLQPVAEEPSTRAPSPESVNPERPSLSPEEAAIRDLATKYGRITAKVLTEELPISRATATRRLSVLSEAGELVQHGKGRGTYYTLAEHQSRAEQDLHASRTAAAPLVGTFTTSATSFATDQFLAEIAGQMERLRERFAVAALTSGAPPTTAAMPQIMVHFIETPTLAEFWALRTHLSALAGFPIDLIPQNLTK